ncbi:hypothetical protein SC214_03295, partial [Legionella pneumophila serogroup 1]
LSVVKRGFQMDIHSTYKMLAKMQGNKELSSHKIAETEQAEADTVPQLKLQAEPEAKPDMQNILSNMLGISSNKKHSPMD